MTIREIDSQGITAGKLRQCPGARYTLTCRTCVTEGKKPGSAYLGNISLVILGKDNHLLKTARRTAKRHEKTYGQDHNLIIMEILAKTAAVGILGGELEAEDVGPTY